MYIEQSVEEKIRVCLEEISQHKKDLKQAATPIEKEWLKDELDYWENELLTLKIQAGSDCWV